MVYISFDAVTSVITAPPPYLNLGAFYKSWLDREKREGQETDALSR